MTPAQSDAFNRVNEILREHFTASVMVVETEISDNQVRVEGSYHGGYCAAIGLLEHHKAIMLSGTERKIESE